METNEVKENEETLDGTASETPDTEEAKEAPDWQARCLAAESALSDALAFAALETGVALSESPIYSRFLELRAKGLSEQEAFAAAGWERKRVPDGKYSASKAHLVSGAAATLAASCRISNEDMLLARELLGEGYSTEKLEKLWRRVAKGQ